MKCGSYISYNILINSHYDKNQISQRDSSNLTQNVNKILFDYYCFTEDDLFLQLIIEYKKKQSSILEQY